MILRDYQQECIDIIQSKPPGAYLIQMATGMGKTATFTSIPRQGRVLLLSHREELVKQPLKYYDCKTSVEMAKEHTTEDSEVVSASIMTMRNRMHQFSPYAFDMVICDECHHAGAKTYKEIFRYFKPRMLLGFTATPNRADKVRLDDVFSDIIFRRDLRWGIQNGYLCNIDCKRVTIGYDLSAVHTRNGDYAPGELDKAMDGTADAIAQCYRDLAKGATLIFAVSVNQCNQIAEKIPGAVVVTGETKNRADIIQRFTNREIPCIVNCMVFTEGTDMPLVETVIIARPTQSDALYTQMVGRGLRLSPGKEKLLLIDCVGITGRASLCTAPSLLGIDLKTIPAKTQQEMEGDLLELPEIASRLTDCPQSWIKNVETVDLWAKGMDYNLHGVNYFRMPDGEMVCSIPDGKIRIPPPDLMGRVEIRGEIMEYQTALDRAFKRLSEQHADSRKLWDLDEIKKWGKAPATERQKQMINRMFKDFDTDGLTKMQAGQVLNRMFGRKRA